MKKRWISLALAAVMVCAVLPLSGCGNKKEITGTLTVFNYGEYIDPDVLDQFTEETGIEVKYEEALTPEEMYTKYKTGAIQDRKATYDKDKNPNGRWRCFTKEEFNVEAEKDNSLDFKWIDLEEKDERTIAELLDDMQTESDGIAEAVSMLKNLLGGIEI